MVSEHRDVGLILQLGLPYVNPVHWHECCDVLELGVQRPPLTGVSASHGLHWLEVLHHLHRS